MATDLNRVLLIGRLTKEPELKQTGSGTSYCKFSIANNRNYTANGERKEEVSFFNCVAWARQAEIINQYCRKGKQVAIDGRLQQRSWMNQEGKKQYATDIVVDSLQMLGTPGDGGTDSSGGNGYGQGNQPQGRPTPGDSYSGPTEGAAMDYGDPGPNPPGKDDDDMPF